MEGEAFRLNMILKLLILKILILKAFIRLLFTQYPPLLIKIISAYRRRAAF